MPATDLLSLNDVPAMRYLSQLVPKQLGALRHGQVCLDGPRMQAGEKSRRKKHDVSSGAPLSCLAVTPLSHWALWSRVMLLWFVCIRRVSRGRPHISLSGFSASSPEAYGDTMGQEDTEFAMRAWMETVAIEEALDAHNCKLEQTLWYQTREYIFK
ncbi:hypothetical protein FRB97_003311 [Tulasnella sp. 331]|nr:hypothetical protein FRB97_003311 [Tulasnella sp. 331]